MEILLGILAGLALGGGAVWLAGRGARTAAAGAHEAEKKLAATDARETLLQTQIDTLKTEKAAAETRALASEKAAAQLTERVAAFEELGKQAKTEFAQLATQALEKQGKNFAEQSEKNLKGMLDPLDKEIKEFKTQITGFKAVNDRMTTETENLTKALTSNVKAQGNWGEWNLERILENAGLRKGEGYDVQGAGLDIKSADGARRMPDVVVFLPENKHLIIDSKVSLKSYSEHVNAADETARQAAAKDFVASVAAHIKSLGDKDYANATGLNAPDFVMLFMPLEAAYFLAMQEKEDLLHMAWERNIAIVCPSTLIANLRTIAALWRLQKQNANADEIARVAGGIYDKVSGFVGNMERVGKALDSAQSAHDDAFRQLASGRGNVLKQTEDLKKLGAKTGKSLPAELLTEDDDMPA